KPLTKKNSIDELISFYPQERPSTSRSRNASFNRLRSSSTIWASSLLFFGRRTLSRLRCNGSGTTPEVEYDDAALHPKRRAGCSDLVCLLPELHSRSARHPWREHCSSRRLRAECRRNRSQVRLLHNRLLPVHALCHCRLQLWIIRVHEWTGFID